MKKSVFVTGCSSGLGRSISIQLSREGYRVFSSVRTQSDYESLLNVSREINPIIMDVTDSNQILSAFNEINKLCDNGLYALINNAAITNPTPFEFASEDEIRKLFEINFFSPLNLIRIFLPLLKGFKEKGCRGKIINIASWAGLMHSPWTSLYSSSKSALMGFSEGIYYELKNQGVDVITVIPGLMKTPLLVKTASGIYNSLVKANHFHIYQKELLHLNDITQKAQNNFLVTNPDKIGRKIVQILKKKNPKHRYICGLDSKIVNLLVHFAPFCIRQKIVKRIYQLDN